MALWDMIYHQVSPTIFGCVTMEFTPKKEDYDSPHDLGLLYLQTRM